jgi:hypothetical protein
MSGVVEEIAYIYGLGHRRAVEILGQLSEEQLRWRPGHSTSIAFNFWHIARWADHMRSVLPTITPAMRRRLPETSEIWQTEHVATKWGLRSDVLGYVETGMGMDEGESAKLALPDKAQLMEYAERVFAEAEGAMAALHDDDLAQPAEFDPARVPWAKPADYRTVGNWVIAAISHDSRHLGMIEALKGAVDSRGTASR